LLLATNSIVTDEVPYQLCNDCRRRADIAANDAAGEGATASRGDRRRRGQEIARCDAAPM
jgi:hypothetical protein